MKNPRMISRENPAAQLSTESVDSEPRRVPKLELADLLAQLHGATVLAAGERRARVP